MHRKAPLLIMITDVPFIFRICPAATYFSICPIHFYLTFLFEHTKKVIRRLTLFCIIESTRRRRTSGGRSTATTGAARRHSNRSNPAGLEHRKKSHPSDDSFFYLFESTRRDSNPRPSPWQGDTPPLSHSCIGNIPSKPHIEFHQPLNLHLTFLDKPSTD